MGKVVRITKWGNSCGIRIPADILRKAEMDVNDCVYIESDKTGAIFVSKKPSIKKGTIEYIFKDYYGESFETDLADLGDPMGEEKW